MALSITHILLVLSALQFAVRVGDKPDPATQALLRQRAEEQKREMAWYLQKIEEQSQEPPRLYKLLVACQNWKFWASAEILLMLFGLYWLPRQNSMDSNSELGSSDSEEEAEEDWKVWEEKQEPSDILAEDNSHLEKRAE